MAAADVIIQARWKWSSASAGESGRPMMATRAATPSTAPIWRAVWLSAPPAANRSGGRPATAAALSTGKLRATPSATSRLGPSHVRR